VKDVCLLEFVSLSYNLNVIVEDPSGLITSVMSWDSSADTGTGLQVG